MEIRIRREQGDSVLQTNKNKGSDTILFLILYKVGDNLEKVEDILSELVHLIWCDIWNKICEGGKLDDNKNLIIHNVSLSRYIHFMDKDYHSLTQEEQWSDVRNAQRIIKTLDKHGYMIVKKPNMKRPVYITQEDIDNLKEPK